MAAEVELEHRIQSLPQELQDEIFGYYLIIPTETVTISKTYKTPAQLQINGASREKFAKDYYSTTIFKFEGYASVVEKQCTKWLSSLQSQHLDAIQKVRIVASYEENIEQTTGTYLFNDCISEAFCLIRMRNNGVYLRRSALLYQRRRYH